MKTIIPQYLEELKQSHSQDSFLFQKFWIAPDKSLGGRKEETLKDYYLYGDIKNLILNKNFYPFLRECLQIEEFSQKLDDTLLRKLRFMLFDIYDLKKEYLIDLEDEYLRNFCRNKVPLGPIYCKKYNQLELYFISEHYQRFGWLYDLKITKEKLNQIDKKLLEDLIQDNNWRMDAYYDTYIKPLEDKKMYLKIIETDNYAESDSCLLYHKNGYDKKSFQILVCDNDFIDIVNKLLIRQILPNSIIANIISILELGINLKTHQYSKILYEKFYGFYPILAPEKINSFQHKRAKELITVLKEKKTPSKIIPFIRKKKI